MVTIRQCKEEDLERIIVLNRVLGYDYPPEEAGKQLKKILARPTDTVLVACVDGTVAGYIQVSDYEALYMDSMKNIMGLVVDDVYQGQGVGRALLKAAEQLARDSGCKGVRLNSGMSRKGAHVFYETCGYCHLKDHKNFVKRF